ncbi:hypothetical protein [Salmonella sp. S090_02723]|uniref:hypothetical protein n=1 Tax=Salmonella sp. S090_02723 TaxID=2665583 RepID=UPI001659B907|nr:hypothetical protein [Salmonella sp. S090_02723]
MAVGMHLLLLLLLLLLPVFARQEGIWALPGRRFYVDSSSFSTALWCKQKKQILSCFLSGLYSPPA